jgi:hypothetical protein
MYRQVYGHVGGQGSNRAKNETQATDLPEKSRQTGFHSNLNLNYEERIKALHLEAFSRPVGILNVEMLFDIFCDHFTVEQVNDAVGIICIVRRVRYHDDGCTLFIQLGKKLHYLFAIG